MNDHEILEILLTKMDKIQIKIENIESKQTENSNVLNAIQHSNGLLQARYEELKMDVAKLSSDLNQLVDKMHQGFKEINDTQKFLLEMYGTHEADIRSLKERLFKQI